MTALATGIIVTPPTPVGTNRFVPADGTAQYLVTGNGQAASLETAIHHGGIFTLADPQANNDLYQLASIAGTEHVLWMVERVRGDLERTVYSRFTPEGRQVISVVWQGNTVFYPDGRLDQPVDAPARWRDSGAVTIRQGGHLQAGHFELVAHSSEDEFGCLTIRYEEQITISGDAPFETTREERRCPGDGLVTIVDGTTRWAASRIPPPPPDVGTAERAQTPTLPTEIVPLAFPSRAGLIDTTGPGFAAGRDRVVLVVDLGEHVMSLARDGDTLAYDWVAHPGGHITAFGVFGDLALVLTSQRHAVAYSANGVRAWETELAEVCTAGPVRLDYATVVVGCRDGALHALDLATGAIVWTYGVEGELNADPLTHAGVVYLTDATNNLLAIKNGELAWRSPLDGAAIAMGIPSEDNSLYVSTYGGSEVFVLDLATGEETGTIWVGQSVSLAPMTEGMLAGHPSTLRTLGPAPGPSYSGAMRSFTATGQAAIVDTGTDIVVTTLTGARHLNTTPFPGTVTTYWSAGDGEWLLTDMSGNFWSVR